MKTNLIASAALVGSLALASSASAGTITDTLHSRANSQCRAETQAADGVPRNCVSFTSVACNSVSCSISARSAATGRGWFRVTVYVNR